MKNLIGLFFIGSLIQSGLTDVSHLLKHSRNGYLPPPIHNSPAQQDYRRLTSHQLTSHSPTGFGFNGGQNRGYSPPYHGHHQHHGNQPQQTQHHEHHQQESRGYLPPHREQNHVHDQHHSQGQQSQSTSNFDHFANHQEDSREYLPPHHNEGIGQQHEHQGHLQSHDHHHSHVQNDRGYLPPHEIENQIQNGQHHHHDHQQENKGYLPPQQGHNPGHDHHGHQQESQGYSSTHKEQNLGHDHHGYVNQNQGQDLNGIAHQPQTQGHGHHHDLQENRAYLPPHKVEDHSQSHHDHHHDQNHDDHHYDHHDQHHAHHHDDHHDQHTDNHHDHHHDHQQQTQGYLPPHQGSNHGHNHQEKQHDQLNTVQQQMQHGYDSSVEAPYSTHQPTSGEHDNAIDRQSQDSFEDNSHGYDYSPPNKAFEDGNAQPRSFSTYNRGYQVQQNIPQTSHSGFENSGHSRQKIQQGYQQSHSAKPFALKSNQPQSYSDINVGQQVQQNIAPTSHSGIQSSGLSHHETHQNSNQQFATNPAVSNPNPTQGYSYSNRNAQVQQTIAPKGHSEIQNSEHSQQGYQQSFEAKQPISKSPINTEYQTQKNTISSTHIEHQTQENVNRGYLPPSLINPGNVKPHFFEAHLQNGDSSSKLSTQSHMQTEQDYQPPIGALELPQSSDTLHIVPSSQLGIPVQRTRVESQGSKHVNVPLPIPSIGYYFVPGVVTELPSESETKTEPARPAINIPAIVNPQQTSVNDQYSKHADSQIQTPVNEIRSAEYSNTQNTQTSVNDIRSGGYSNTQNTQTSVNDIRSGGNSKRSGTQIRIIPSIQTARDISSSGFLTPIQAISNGQRFDDDSYYSQDNQQYFPPLDNTQEPANQQFEQNQNVGQRTQLNQQQNNFGNFAQNQVQGVINQQTQISRPQEVINNQGNSDYSISVQRHQYHYDQSEQSYQDGQVDNPALSANYNRMTGLQSYMKTVQPNDRYASVQYQTQSASEEISSPVTPPIMFSRPSAVKAYAPGMSYMDSSNTPLNSLPQAGYLPPARSSSPQENQQEYMSSIGYELNKEAKQSIAMQMMHDNTVFPVEDLIGIQDEDMAQIMEQLQEHIRTIQITNDNNKSVRNIKVLESADQSGVKTIEILGPTDEDPMGEHRVLRVISKSPNSQGIQQTIKIFADSKNPAATTTSAPVKTPGSETASVATTTLSSTIASGLTAAFRSSVASSVPPKNTYLPPPVRKLRRRLY